MMLNGSRILRGELDQLRLKRRWRYSFFLLSSVGSLAMLLATRRASSIVSAAGTVDADSRGVVPGGPMSDRVKLARAIAARTKPRFIEIPRELLTAQT